MRRIHTFFFLFFLLCLLAIFGGNLWGYNSLLKQKNTSNTGLNSEQRNVAKLLIDYRTKKIGNFAAFSRTSFSQQSRFRTKKSRRCLKKDLKLFLCGHRQRQTRLKFFLQKFDKRAFTLLTSVAATRAAFATSTVNNYFGTDVTFNKLASGPSKL